MSVRSIASVLVMAALAGPAVAGVTYTSQARQVTAVAGQPPVFATPVTAPDFGPFHGEVYLLVPDPTFADSWGRGVQDSTLTEGGISFSGYCEGQDGYGGGGAGSGAGGSTLDVTFTVTGSAGWTWSLVGDVTTQGREPFTMSVVLSRVSGTPVELFRYGTFDPDFSVTGALPDGEYRLTASMQGGWAGFGTGYSITTYDVQLTIVPGPGSGGLLAVAGLIAARRRRGKRPAR